MNRKDIVVKRRAGVYFKDPDIDLRDVHLKEALGMDTESQTKIKRSFSF